MKKGFIIAIDGPLASGKGTIAKKVAHALGGIDLYTGAMYRCVALFCINSGINLKNTADVISQLDKIAVMYRNNRIMLNGTDVTEAIQDSSIAEGASVVAVIPRVRKELVARQRRIGSDAVKKGRIVVVEGRDIGTAVFPQAALKIYLTASVAIRAKRRLLQLQKQGEKVILNEVLEQIHLRDRRDMERKIDPLASDPKQYGYFVIDNSQLKQEQTIHTIITELKRRNLLND